MMSGIGPVYPPLFTNTHDYHTPKLPLPTGRNPVQIQGQAFRESIHHNPISGL